MTVTITTHFLTCRFRYPPIVLSPESGLPTRHADTTMRIRHRDTFWMLNSVLHSPFASYVGNRRHSHSDDEQERPGQPDSRDNAQALDQDTRQRQSQRAQRT